MDCGAFLEQLGSPSFQATVKMPPDLVCLVAGSLRGSGIALALFDPEDRLAFAGDLFARIYNIPPGRPTFDEIIRHCQATATGPVLDTANLDDWLSKARLKRRSQRERHFEVDLLDGRWLLASETLHGDGWLLLSLTDITVLKASEQTLRHARDAAVRAAETDFLTGLFNRRRIMLELSETMTRCCPSKEPLSVALIDLDQFKAINDAYGHRAGNKVLCHFAERARASIRRTDVLGRVGGEEFLIVMPGPVDAARRTAERLRGRIAQSRPLRDIDLGYTVCAGLAEWRDGDTADDLYHRADLALYEAKRAGRNRVVLSGTPMLDARSA